MGKNKMHRKIFKFKRENVSNKSEHMKEVGIYIIQHMQQVLLRQ